MRIAIVGGAGQVGSTLLRRLHERADVSVFAVTRNNFSAEPLRDRGYEVRVGSVVDPVECAKLIDSADLIINAALQLGLPREARAANETIIRRLIRQGRGTVVHFSTVAVYGSCLDRNFSSFDRPRPDSTYGSEKLHLEEFAAREARAAGRRLVVLRLGHVYGPGQGWSKEFLDRLHDPDWRLPFGGEIDSNAVHVYRLADGLPGLINDGVAIQRANAVDAPQSTWRDLFELHADAGGSPPAEGMSQDESERLRAWFCGEVRRGIPIKATAALKGWFSNLPLKRLADEPAVRRAMDMAMLKLPAGFEDLVYRRYQRFSAAHQIPALGGGATADPPPPWYFSDAVPGPNAFRPRSEGEAHALREATIVELRDWYASWIAPTWRAPVNAGRAGL